MPKLTDTQLVILTAAAKREDGTILPLPRRIKLEAKAATALFKALIKRKLVAERSAKGSEPSWRESAEGERMTLTVTDAGLQAIGVEPDEKASSGRSKPRATAKPARSPADPASGRSRGSKPAHRSPAQAHPRTPPDRQQAGPTDRAPAPARRSQHRWRWPRRPAGKAIPCGVSCPAP